MRPYPPLRSLTEPKTALDGGHLWIQEYVTGPILGFTVADSGLVSFGTGGETFDTAPPSLRRAVTHVRSNVDRDRLRSGVDDVTQFVFYGIATRNEGVDYDWTAIPPFLGVDIWAGADDNFVPPDVAERVFDTIGLVPVPAFEKERPAAHFDPDSYELPESHWRDGPAAGVILREKGGGRYLLEGPPATEHATDIETIVESTVPCLVDDELDRLDATAETVDATAMTDRIFDCVARVCYVAVSQGLESDPEAVRQMVGEAVRTEIEHDHEASSDEQ